MSYDDLMTCLRINFKTISVDLGPDFDVINMLVVIDALEYFVDLHLHTFMRTLLIGRRRMMGIRQSILGLYVCDHI